MGNAIFNMEFVTEGKFCKLNFCEILFAVLYTMNFLTNLTKYDIIITNETFRGNLQHDVQYPIYAISEPLHVKLPLGRFKGTRHNTRGHQAETTHQPPPPLPNFRRPP
jgi:hypothetical protein